jgi:futalosine hydrolase
VAGSEVFEVLVLTAVPAEAAAVLSGFDVGETVELGPYRGTAVKTGAGRVAVLAGGVGPARAAACAGTALALSRPALLVVAGVAGGFAGRAAVGDAVLADAIVHADLGAGSPGGFLPISELGFGADRALPEPALVALAAARTGAVVGPVLTVSTVTGTDAGAAELAGRYDPVAEAMEGAGGWAAAEAYGVPILELRAVSNPVGRRDRSTWDLPAALATLTRAVADLFQEPLP